MKLSQCDKTHLCTDKCYHGIPHKCDGGGKLRGCTRLMMIIKCEPWVGAAKEADRLLNDE